MQMLRFFFFVVLFFLSSCGLQPAYNPETAEKLAQVRFVPMADREGQILRSALQITFDPQGLDLNPAYEFSGGWSTNIVFLLPEDTDVRSARGTLTLQGSLKNLDGQVLWTGSLSASALFAQHVLPSISADAQERLWQNLSAQLAQDLAVVISDIL